MKIILCNESGEKMCGSDGIIELKKRTSGDLLMEIASKYRSKYRPAFPEKFEFWTHFSIVDSIGGNTKFIKKID